MTITLTPFFSLMIPQGIAILLIFAVLAAYLANIIHNYYRNKNLLRIQNGERVE